MKVLKITSKNLKLLLRSKTSIFVVIFAPLLIMLLVGFAFNNPSISKLNIGYFSSEKTNMTESFVKALQENNNFIVSEFSSEEQCKAKIEQGKIHICIVFPEDFRLENNKTNEITFFVDQSRANFVYAVIETVSTKIDFTSNQLSYQMTNDLIKAIETSKKINNENILLLIKLKASTDDVSKTLSDIQTKLNNIDLQKTTGSSGNANTEITSINTEITNLKAKGLQVVTLSEDFVDDVVETVSNETLKDEYEADLVTLKGEITNASTKATAASDSLKKSIESMTKDVDNLNKKLDSAKTTTAEQSQRVIQLKTQLDELKTNLDSLKSNIEKVNTQINAIKITSADSIVNPIKTTITPINSKANNLNFIFPYLLILIIVFISIMLSSNIIITEKTSKALFRNFTTPTSDLTFIVSVFLSSVFIVVLQLILIFALAYYFLDSSIASNINLTIVVVFVSIILFTLIGMIIGYLFKNQDAVTMAAISVGSVLLFLSNLVLPLETMSVYIQDIAQYNPYVIASELLKKLTLFGSSWQDVSMDFALLGLYILVCVVLVFIVQKISKVQYISKKPLTKAIKKEELVDRYFKLNSGIMLKDEKDLLDELKSMDDVTFTQYVDKKKNDFEGWMILNKKAAIAKKLGQCKTREEMIKVLEKIVKE